MARTLAFTSPQICQFFVGIKHTEKVNKKKYTDVLEKIFGSKSDEEHQFWLKLMEYSSLNTSNYFLCYYGDDFVQHIQNKFEDMGNVADIDS